MKTTVKQNFTSNSHWTVHLRFDQIWIFYQLFMEGPHSHSQVLCTLSIMPWMSNTFYLQSSQESWLTRSILFVQYGSQWKASLQPLLNSVWSIPLSHRTAAGAPTWRMSGWHGVPRLAGEFALRSPSLKVSKCNSRRGDYFQGFHETCSRRGLRDDWGRCCLMRWRNLSGLRSDGLVVGRHFRLQVRLWVTHSF